jgi:hypothetical protein
MINLFPRFPCFPISLHVLTNGIAEKNALRSVCYPLVCYEKTKRKTGKQGKRGKRKERLMNGIYFRSKS